ncbi:MAG TPA: lysophospholipase [Cyanobacteria bacterium UBA8803]|nr:lysophospholipase [Cyanobacteria bacterium UBA8803]
MSTLLKTCPAWAFFSLAANGLLVLAIAWVLFRQDQGALPSAASQSVVTNPALVPNPTAVPELGPRHQLNYQQWVTLLKQEADVIATKQPDHLGILLGDSISLWFPNELLPPDRPWLNQGISGETSAGLLNRLEVLDRTQPEVIFVMIGINDLIRGVKEDTLLANQQLIIRYLQRTHPQAKIVVQSILPHSADKATWEGRDRLLAIPNRRIRNINHKLKAIAQSEGVIYLDLYPLFADKEGNLQTRLSTDGLHLSPQGYLVWHYALQVFNQLVFEEGMGMRDEG